MSIEKAFGISLPLNYEYIADEWYPPKSESFTWEIINMVKNLDQKPWSEINVNYSKLSERVGSFWYSYNDAYLKERYITYILYLVSPELPTSKQDIENSYVYARLHKDKAKTRTKLGRLLKRCFEWLDDVTVEKICDAYKKEHTPKKLEVYKSDKIAKVVTMEMAKQQNMDCDFWKKALCYSCMRHDFEDQTHPMKAYESGDFEIIYVLDEDGLLCARTISYKNGDIYAPIYATSDYAYNTLKDYLRHNGYKSIQDTDCGWVGARLKLIEEDITNEDDYLVEAIIVPYVDAVINGYGRIVGGYIVIEDCYDPDNSDDYSYFDPYEDYPPKGTGVWLKSADGYTTI